MHRKCKGRTESLVVPLGLECHKKSYLDEIPAKEEDQLVAS